MPTIPVFEQWTWPWPAWTLHGAYLAAALLVAVHYVPLLQRSWRFPGATAKAHALRTWLAWTLCSTVSCTYGLFALHNLIFLIVVGLDLAGRIAMVMLIVRARRLTQREARPAHATLKPVPANAYRNSGTTHSGFSPRATRCTFS